MLFARIKYKLKVNIQAALFWIGDFPLNFPQ